MKPHDNAWERLAAAARRNLKSADEAAPYGFSTRVAAMAAGRPSIALVPVWLRAAGVACLLAVVVAASNYSSITGLFRGQLADSEDAVDVIDTSS